MPHRVADFLRSSTETFSAAAITTLKSSIRHQQQPSRSSSGLRIERRSSRSSSVSDDSDDGIPYHHMYSSEYFPPLKRRDDRERKEKKEKSHHHHHRLPLPFGRSKDVHENPHASLSWNIESPPIVFYGDVQSSTGALVSGQINLDIKDESFEIECFGAALNIHVHQKRPFANHCADCADQYTQLKSWTFLGQPATLNKGRHQFPFSILLEGHLPASMDTPVLSISYEFKAEVVPANGKTNPKISNIPIKLDRHFDVKRSLPASDTPHHSVRVFPPTNIKAGAEYGQIIHPAAANNKVSLRLDGLASTNNQARAVETWKLKKVTWKLEETVKTVAPACKKHAPAQAEGSSATGKGVSRQDTRILGEKHLYQGWKADYSVASDGHVDLEFDYGVAASLLSNAGASSSKHHGGSHNGIGYACDTRSSDGTEVSHALMVEMVVSKEWAPVGKPQLTAQTGTGRILRMHYHVLLTEVPGLGVSWDNESPPVYQDVPPSPPGYPDGGPCPIEYESLEPLDGMRHGNGSPEPSQVFQWDRREMREDVLNVE